MQKSVQSWTKPELVRLGKIGDVAAQALGTRQCGATGGGCSNKS
ncbi:MAG: hypothetical protein U1E37_04980 [Sphingomonadaceae bacterium]